MFESWIVGEGVRTHGIEAATVNEGGRGFVATEDIEEGSLLLQVPEKLLMTSRSARDESTLQAALACNSELSASQVLTVHLLHEISKKEASFWRAYLLQLPRSHSTLAHFTEDQALALQVPYAVNTARDAAAAEHASWKLAMPVLKALSLPPKLRSLKTWVWAAATVSSRTVSVVLESQGGEVTGALCPLGDLFNYAPPTQIPAEDPLFSRTTPPGVEMESTAGGVGSYDSEHCEYRFYAKGAYKRSQQVLMCYGQYTNLELLEHYGFLLPGTDAETPALNGHDSVLTPAPMLERFGVTPDCCRVAGPGMHITASGAPSWALLVGLRLSTAAPHERRTHVPNVLAGNRISIKGDIEALKRLKEMCELLLQALPTTIEEDRVKLEEARIAGLSMKGPADHDTGDPEVVIIPGAESHLKIAIEWRIGFKVILRRCSMRCEVAIVDLQEEATSITLPA